jgi:hypothetical protein
MNFIQNYFIGIEPSGNCLSFRRISNPMIYCTPNATLYDEDLHWTYPVTRIENNLYKWLVSGI